jgi:hypothetical protein
MREFMYKAVETYEKVEVQLHALSSILDGGEWSVPSPPRLLFLGEGLSTVSAAKP